MMQHVTLGMALCFFALAGLSAQADKPDYDAMRLLSYDVKVLAFDYSFGNSYASTGCPSLPEAPVFIHGAKAYFPVTPWLRLGAAGYGISRGIYDSENITFEVGIGFLQPYQGQTAPES